MTVLQSKPDHLSKRAAILNKKGYLTFGYNEYIHTKDLGLFTT